MTDAFDNYFFTSNLTGNVCPTFGSFKCPPPNACARDPKTGKEYCCDYGDVCWTIPSKCASDGSTANCGSGSDSWCCLDKTEVCTASPGQINICWNSALDTLTNISSTVLNKTYSSLSSASPSASSWRFTPIALIAQTATTSVITTSTSPASQIITPTNVLPSSTNTPVPKSESSGISGGAIAGIVVGVLALLLLVAGAFFFYTRNKNKRDKNAGMVHEAPSETNGPPYNPKAVAGMHELSPEGRPAELNAGGDGSVGANGFYHGKNDRVAPQELQG